METVAEHLGRSFYRRDTATVAQELLGKIIIRRLEQHVLSGRIVETEAYFGDKDPASRAYRGRKNYNTPMFDDPGRLFIYMVHSWWLLNIAAHEPGEVGALLRREGLYSSHLSSWRAARERGELGGGGTRKRGPEPKASDPSAKRIAKLEQENRQLRRRAERAEGLVEVQKKLSELLSIDLPSSDGNS